MSQSPKSGVVIAQLLDCEGFSPHAAGAVYKWAKNEIANDRVRQRANRKKKAFSEMIARVDLSEADRLIMGAFIATKERAAFEAGLRIGLAANFTASANLEDGETIGDIE